VGATAFFIDFLTPFTWQSTRQLAVFEEARLKDYLKPKLSDSFD